MFIENATISETLKDRQGCHTSGKSQGKVYFFKVREMSGNFEICQGKIEYWKMSWKTDLCQGKIEFPGVHANHFLILGHQVPIFSSFPIKI